MIASENDVFENKFANSTNPFDNAFREPYVTSDHVLTDAQFN